MATALATAGAYSATDYEQYAYDNNGNQTSVRRRDAQVIGHNFDALNHENWKDMPGGTAQDVYITYYLTGEVKSKRFVSTSGSGVVYGYDGLRRLTSSTDAYSRSVWYGYNEAGARAAMVFPDGNGVNYVLDAANRVTSASYGGSTQFGQSYNDLGQLTTITKGTTGSTTYGYDAMGRLSERNDILPGSTAPDAGWTFSYSPAGQLKKLSTSASYPNTTLYDYKEKTSSTVPQTWDGLNRDAAIAALSGVRWWRGGERGWRSRSGCARGP